MNLPVLKIGELVARIPIIQGGMGIGISLSGLASAVANEGAIGVISAAMIGMEETDLTKNYLEANIRALENEIRKARAKTKGILGVNIMVALTNFADMVNTAIKERVDIIFCGAGLPLDLPKYLVKGINTKLVPIVSSAKAAKIICMKWLRNFKYLPDAFVVEGPLAGGHLGFKTEQIESPEYTLEKILPEVVAAVKSFEKEHNKKIPVIAAGGIYSGEDINKFLKLGAAGVQIATRFVATEECDADKKFKEEFIKSKEEDIVLINSPVGLPGRAIKNRFLEEVNSGVKKPFNCPYHCIITCDYKQSTYCIALALINAKKGKLNKGFAFAGQNAFRVNKITTVKELITSLIEEFKTAAKEKTAFFPCNDT
ncbi:MAG: 2-nitropropane dioxygenase [Candidatus Schekmanbacteria bacterium RIFCSPHIGHO2_02_FULL_38_11]|uniref:2-nitropropane dioxygenase n=1 Tax=Candidatus Schekmanbacteria bacterium RIFCSPLOWO2_12_FULL_38_15 TaxID=1817883 RepID=A0A1F7SFV3_9BACT|nr:MAG: 2-nitropropane dioxygenase [Candidatus Schekmanbacteria bacterium GWA2_38_9]OGL49142.1 MAG: 2-nitropropane dioxygenase [Candidatus Schekmanbacteria bacterium RIFCSPLOWO2_02_FULL_38_14]OGL51604.1 MAG: 2-nitropropane dioxygenase [Candidatus Schekmanbacteria bacterium RIFCSPHIGHO2_02_FULL_38_11]OGL52118.1 MAG: 2-nitropropane dioxygenase [Candidatus Schekmanbacteria bacterium RIFCSPLOWO2_12_FULL_38_15]